ncbi:4HBT domain containing protein, partial [Asbolus verrucosus]
MVSKVLDVPRLLHFIKKGQGFDRIMHKIKILSVGDGKCLAQLKVDDDHINPMGGLHGGMSATLLDCVSSYALMSKDGPTFRHVSVDIYLNYLKTAKINDDLLIDASVVKRGDQLAFLQAEIKNKTTGDVLVKCANTKSIYSYTTED